MPFRHSRIKKSFLALAVDGVASDYLHKGLILFLRPIDSPRSCRGVMDR